MRANVQQMQTDKAARKARILELIADGKDTLEGINREVGVCDDVLQKQLITLLEEGKVKRFKERPGGNTPWIYRLIDNSADGIAKGPWHVPDNGVRLGMHFGAARA